MTPRLGPPGTSPSLNGEVPSVSRVMGERLCAPVRAHQRERLCAVWASDRRGRGEKVLSPRRKGGDFSLQRKIHDGGRPQRAYNQGHAWKPMMRGDVLWGRAVGTCCGDVLWGRAVGACLKAYHEERRPHRRDPAAPLPPPPPIPPPRFPPLAHACAHSLMRIHTADAIPPPPCQRRHARA